MTDSREKFCVRACEGIGTGELAAILEGGSTLQNQFQGVVEKREAALAQIHKTREDLSIIRDVIETSCCTALMDKTSVLSAVDHIIHELSEM